MLFRETYSRLTVLKDEYTVNPSNYPVLIVINEFDAKIHIGTIEDTVPRSCKLSWAHLPIVSTCERQSTLTLYFFVHRIKSLCI
jgi:hypothetical protein